MKAVTRSLAMAALLVGMSVAAVVNATTQAQSSDIASYMLKTQGAKRPAGCPTKWCACGLNKVLAKHGYKSVKSNRAIDLKNAGKRVSGPKPGVLMVMSHHVALVIDPKKLVCKKGYVPTVSDNHGNRRGVGCYPRSAAKYWVKPVKI